MLPELGAPWSLLGLVSIPFIRWIHRFRELGTLQLVAAVFLWQTGETTADQSRKTAMPDPRWRHRALIVALMVLALADPRLPATTAPPLLVWWDDALSMRAVENGLTRHAQAIELLVTRIDSEGSERVELRPLRGSGGPLTLERDNRHAWSPEITAWSDALVTAARDAGLPLLGQAQRQWLVTDGADPALDRWTGLAVIDEVVAVGVATENLSLTRLSLREEPDPSDGIAGLALVLNSGLRPAAASIRVLHGDELVGEGQIQLGPQQTLPWRFGLDAVSGAVSVRLERSGGRSDPLIDDDALTLDPRDAFDPVPVAVDGTCPAPVLQAVEAHPGLSRQPQLGRTTGGLRIACSASRPTSDRPLLWFPSELPRAGWARAHAQWLDRRPAARSYIELPRSVGVLEPRADVGQPLLEADGQVLAALDAQAPVRITVLIDLQGGRFGQTPAFAELFAGLVERAAGPAGFGRTASVDRPAASSIQPKPPSPTGTGSAVSSPESSNSVALALVVLATVGLLADLVVSARRQSVDSH